MSQLILIQDTLDLARDLAIEIEMRDMPPTREQIVGALQVMDAKLFGAGEDVRTLLGIERGFAIPDFELEVDLIDDAEFATTEIGASVVKARIDGFRWIGSAVTTGFGIRLFGVDVIEPKRDRVPTAFVPLEAVNIRLAA